MIVNALVTAKSFSDRVPYKNLQMLEGQGAAKQLYKWTTDFLEKNSEIFGSIFFSSDQPDAFDYNKGLIRTIRRPEALCDDSVLHVASVKHAIIHMRNQLDVPDYIMLFQPTNPFHSRRVIENAIQLAKEENLEEVYSYYTDTNLRTNYIKHSNPWLPSDFVKVKSGNFYLYKVSALASDSRICPECNGYATFEWECGLCGGGSYHGYIPRKSPRRYQSLEVPKFAGYNINNQEDFGIVTALAKCHVLGGSDYEL